MRGATIRVGVPLGLDVQHDVDAGVRRDLDLTRIQAVEVGRRPDVLGDVRPARHAPQRVVGRRLARLGIAKMLRGELSLAIPETAGPLSACGVIVVNPPWTLPDELEVLLASLSRLLSPTGDGTCRVDWLRGEK